MPLVTQSALLKALGWSLFNSLWQMALLWLLYLLLISVFKNASAHIRHGLALILLGAGTGWCLLSFITDYSLAGLVPVAAPAIMPFINQLLPYCSFLYLLVLLFLLLRYSNHYLHSRRLKSEGLYRVGPELRLFVAEMSRRMGIRKEVSVWLSSLVEGPVTLGFLKPVILIPFATVNNLSLQQVEAILLHELAHIKRYDYLLNLGVAVLEIFFFFNPFVRLLIRDLKREREHRCDDLVLQFRYDPHSYVCALLSLATKGRSVVQRLALSAAGRHDQFLLQRVKRILQQQKPVNRPGRRPIVLFLFALLTALVTLSGPVKQAERLNEVRARAASIGVRIGESGGLEFRSQRLEFKPQGWEFRSQTMPAPDKDPASKPVRAQKRRAAVNPDYPDGQNEPMSREELIAASNEDAGEKVSPEDAVPAVQADPRAYSIGQSDEAAIAPEAADGEELPFVPNSSFSFRYMDDTTRPGQPLSSSELAARQAMEKAIKALEAMDWKKIEKEVTGKNGQIDIRKLEQKIRQAMRETNWEKINRETSLAGLDEISLRRMEEDLNVQNQALRELKSRNQQNRQQTLRLKKQILENQLKLQQGYILQEQEPQESRKKGEKTRRTIIIYI